jgi:phosphate transport system substrate-binding protein
MANLKKLLQQFVLTAMAAGAVAPATAGTITMKGSDTLVILAQKWAEAYMAKHPGTKIQINGGGSGVGLAALQNRGTDLANASRKIKTAENLGCIQAFGRRPTEYRVALDGLSVYVNSDNPVNEITLDQLAKVLTGKIRNWQELGGHDAPITLYGRESSSGTYELLKEQVMKGKDFISTIQTMPGTAALLQAVARDKNGLGCGGAAYGKSAKHLAVRKEKASPAIEPTEENVEKGIYPIWRYLYIYLNPALEKGEIAAYLNWIRSDEGQEVVREVGYFPLPKHLRQ